MKELFNRITKQLSKLGKAFLIPLTATPIAGLLGRLSAPDLLNLPILENAAWTVFGMMDLLFAVGAVMAYSKAKDKAIPIIASIISLEIFKSVLQYMDSSIDMGVFSGIVVGVMTSIVYNYSKEWKIPEIFIFFRGEKLVVTLAPIIAITLALIFSFIWIPCQFLLDSFGMWIAAAGAIGVFIYGILNRILLPFGLHHIINSYIYYELGSFVTSTGEVVKGEIPRFLAGDPTAGLFLAMFFIPMIFGLPGACLALYKSAYNEYKKQTKTFFASNALTSFVSGITEPIEFSFMFNAPCLYCYHAFLTGLSGSILYLFDVHLGMSVNFCIIDFVMNYKMGTNAWIIFPVGIVFFILYYFGFYTMIHKFNLSTPGRQSSELCLNVSFDTLEDEDWDFDREFNNHKNTAQIILAGVGGKNNIIDVECCVTRLRLELVNISIIDEAIIKTSGSKGIMKFGNSEIQIVIGSDVNRVAKELNKLLE